MHSVHLDNSNFKQSYNQEYSLKYKQVLLTFRSLAHDIASHSYLTNETILIFKFPLKRTLILISEQEHWFLSYI